MKKFKLSSRGSLTATNSLASPSKVMSNGRRVLVIDDGFANKVGSCVGVSSLDIEGIGVGCIWIEVGGIL